MEVGFSRDGSFTRQFALFRPTCCRHLHPHSRTGGVSQSNLDQVLPRFIAVK